MPDFNTLTAAHRLTPRTGSQSGEVTQTGPRETRQLGGILERYWSPGGMPGQDEPLGETVSNIAEQALRPRALEYLVL